MNIDARIIEIYDFVNYASACVRCPSDPSLQDICIIKVFFSSFFPSLIRFDVQGGF